MFVHTVGMYVVRRIVARTLPLVVYACCSPSTNYRGLATPFDTWAYKRSRETHDATTRELAPRVVKRAWLSTVVPFAVSPRLVTRLIGDPLGTTTPREYHTRYSVARVSSFSDSGL